MKIKILGPEDADAYQSQRLLALRESSAMFSASYEDEVDRSLEQVASRLGKDSAVTFGIFKRNELAGFAAVIRSPREKLSHCVEVAGMYVNPKFRRLGYGRDLMRAVITYAQSTEGVRQIKLGVNVKNIAAKSLYSSFGFKSYGIEPQALFVEGVFYDQEHYFLRIEPANAGTA